MTIGNVWLTYIVTLSGVNDQRLLSVQGFKYRSASLLSVKMPKQGFTGITVSTDLKNRLAETTKTYGYRSVPDLIESLLAGIGDGTVTGTGTSEPCLLRSVRNGAETRSLSRSGWCGGWDFSSNLPARTSRSWHSLKRPRRTVDKSQSPRDGL